MSNLLRDYDYSLPQSLIAAHPLGDRAASRMMVLHRAERRIEHRMFMDFPGYLQPGDLAVLNDTKVIPARAFSDDSRFEFLFLEPRGGNRWLCMAKPGRKLQPGVTTSVGGVAGIVAEVLPAGERVIQFDAPIDLDRVGKLPIPPYLGREVEPSDSERYQTVYARHPGAVAAPTAGLHFTPRILAQVPHTFITLHVGAGTFRPVQTEQIRDHTMHRERFEISAAAADAIRAAKRSVAIGTTTVRVLESCADHLAPQAGSTDIFIYPPYQFRMAGALLTNFHLPKSTLLMLVSAFAGREFILEAYGEAVREKYRFFSYGDCMLIL
ncbi:MAG TPA: tRNA preQ1(34) S-adenosylmethionine ribosyltransferase-isomerase QueA [Chthoniobacteraceae bacterium]|jgi:S-adenosylmethionine:tRNA ribosyltransferase-isomerase|nr:tRNA preQ1(34) S-adenosylmethionine ribosyltransferase-isomerase QueA [Chthoniobacteraceae bacterium]